jgi:hypothetical protein
MGLSHARVSPSEAYDLLTDVLSYCYGYQMVWVEAPRDDDLVPILFVNAANDNLVAYLEPIEGAEGWQSVTAEGVITGHCCNPVTLALHRASARMGVELPKLDEIEAALRLYKVSLDRLTLADERSGNVTCAPQKPALTVVEGGLVQYSHKDRRKAGRTI